MKKELANILEEIRGCNILVVGDMVADIYVDGRISRISREAPVLILEHAGEKIVAGGAANVVNNIATLGGHVFAVGVLGMDESAKGLKSILEENGADTAGLFCDEKRPTISKTRIIAGGRATVSQQIVRIDRESKKKISRAFEEQMLLYIKRIAPNLHGIVLSDYGAGTVTEHLRSELIAMAKERGIPGIVDSRYDIRGFRGIGYVKQNDAELAEAVGREITGEEEVLEAGQELLEAMDADGVLVTRGGEGMILFERGGAIHMIPVADKSEVYDVSGAGDTCVAAMILALATGAEPAQAAELSNVAAGIAVRKLGTSTVGAEELLRALRA